MRPETGPWPAPAKLNLMLRIVGRRPDGYHELQTVFRLLDRLYLAPTEDGRIGRSRPLTGVSEDDDLTVRAARRLQAATGCRQGVRIRVEKRLPMGGGLGGGSSDAATVLVALNRLWGLGLGPEELSAIGLGLGADVPVFIAGRSAWAEGVGERLRCLELPPAWYLVAVPACRVSTAAVFQAPELTRDSAPIRIRDFLVGDRRNDCLPVVTERHPEVAEALAALRRFGEARLTGTGACVFVELGTRAEARQALERLPKTLPGFVARGSDRSPLLDMVAGRGRPWHGR